MEEERKSRLKERREMGRGEKKSSINTKKSRKIDRDKLTEELKQERIDRKKKQKQ